MKFSVYRWHGDRPVGERAVRIWTGEAACGGDAIRKGRASQRGLAEASLFSRATGDDPYQEQP